AKLTDGLGSRWAILETSYKWHASCRHTHPAADALLDLMRREELSHEQIAEVRARVHQGAMDVLGAVDTPQTVHQAKFSTRTVLEEKAIRLAQFRGAANEWEMRAAIERIGSLDSEARVGRLITGRTP